MNLKQAFLFGILFWLTIFVEISIIGSSPDLSSTGTGGFVFNQMGHTVHLIAIALIAALLARLYYKDSRPAFIDALQVAVLMALIGIILDIMITVPVFINSYTAFFADPNYWIGTTLTIFAFSLSGSYKSFGKKSK